jgi:MoxR-like ATPase
MVDGVRVTAEVRSYIADVTRATRDERMLSLGASPRATVALFRASRAAAVIEGRDFVIPDDVKGVAPAVLRHRITLAPELEVEGRTPDDVLSALLARVRVPE